jgi:hypothetical protein
MKIVSLHDQALLDCDREQLEKYAETRNLDDLDLTKCKEQPTIFVASPLQAKWEYLLDGSVGATDLWSVFRSHIIEVLNASEMIKDFNLFEQSAGQKMMRDEAREQIFDPDTIAEVATVIIQAPSRFDKRPFVTLDTSWLRAWARAKSLRALNAPTEAAK